MLTRAWANCQKKKKWRVANTNFVQTFWLVSGQSSMLNNIIEHHKRHGMQKESCDWLPSTYNYIVLKGRAF